MRNWAEMGRRISHSGGIIVYASGLYAFALTMRSLSEFAAQILPTLGAVVLSWLFGRLHHPAVSQPPEEDPPPVAPEPAAEPAKNFV